MTKYQKPHLRYAQQLDHLVNRGMECCDRVAAEHALEGLGYYRLSAYAYSFRILLSDDSVRKTSVQYRADEFTTGATFELVAKLARFDRAIRMLCWQNEPLWLGAAR